MNYIEIIEEIKKKLQYISTIIHQNEIQRSL